MNAFVCDMCGAVSRGRRATARGFFGDEYTETQPPIGWYYLQRIGRPQPALLCGAECIRAVLLLEVRSLGSGA